MSKSVGKRSYVSLRRIAELCGVSRMTVSRAFDPARPVSAALRERILEVAAREGYRPDRLVTEVMTTFARSRRAGYRETLAALWWGMPSRRRGASGFAEQVWAGLDEGAEFHGCRFDHFDMESKAQRSGLARVLKARGIRGVVVTPPMGEPDLSALLPWEQFTAVAIGSSLRSPVLHRTQHNHHQGAVRAVEEVTRRGYRRPVLLIGRDFDERSDRVVSGAFLARYPDAGRIVFAGEAGMVERLRELRPDAVVADSDWSLPADLRAGFVALSVNRDGACAGIVQRPEMLASAAVDLLLRSRWRGETGTPDAPMVLMTAGEWNEGATLSGVVRGNPAPCHAAASMSSRTNFPELTLGATSKPRSKRV